MQINQMFTSLHHLQSQYLHPVHTPINPVWYIRIKAWIKGSIWRVVPVPILPSWLFHGCLKLKYETQGWQYQKRIVIIKMMNKIYLINLSYNMISGRLLQQGLPEKWLEKTQTNLQDGCSGGYLGDHDEELFMLIRWWSWWHWWWEGNWRRHRPNCKVLAED